MENKTPAVWLSLSDAIYEGYIAAIMIFEHELATTAGIPSLAPQDVQRMTDLELKAESYHSKVNPLSTALELTNLELMVELKIAREELAHRATTTDVQVVGRGHGRQSALLESEEMKGAGRGGGKKGAP